jgi:hypothetical protein
VKVTCLWYCNVYMIMFNQYHMFNKYQ